MFYRNKLDGTWLVQRIRPTRHTEVGTVSLPATSRWAQVR